MELKKHWLNSSRLFLYSVAIFVGQLIAVLGLVVLRMFFPELDDGFLFGSDFGVFWGASYLGLQGHAADAYEISSLFEALKIANPALLEPKSWHYWFYPPTFHLAILPLATLPFLASYVFFVLATFACYMVVLRRIVHGCGIWLLVLGFSPTILAIYNGQNAFLTAALAGFGLTLLERRPVVAGVCIGLLVIKPHLAILFPLALLCARAWITMLTATITALSFTVASVFVLGVDTVPAFFDNLGAARELASTGSLPLSKMPTVFAAARLLGANSWLANGLHVTVALLGALAVVFAWCNSLPLYLRASVLVVASLLISPHMFDYDLTWLALPIAWLGANGLKCGWHKGGRELLVIVWVSPIVCGGLAKIFNLQLWPLVCVLLIVYLLLCARYVKKGEAIFFRNTPEQSIEAHGFAQVGMAEGSEKSFSGT